ncbi:helix-turn-helix transcriptional regulator [Staphylococcus americanisciuri]|uniref:Helix-turn-helix domain-containing protein n=1 Tax=Staphylococcus americanisciuri TaxID=2973940 RepID=A0ABT2F2E5_9STAP|nr:helix-turn-helix transcriptional regulator [Staphylococcus americanisciuri]MCS4486624.1 helix-turn-helix domain-containing protein [Staphylococcus americanisciuri]
MFPKIYYLSEPMTQPLRCFDSVILVLSLEGEITIKKDGTLYSDDSLYLINESELYEIQSRSALLFYMPSELFRAQKIDIFDQHFIMQQPDIIETNLIMLFNFYQNQEHTSEPAQKLLAHILQDITRAKSPISQTSSDILDGMIEFIHQNIQQRVTLEMLSKRFYVSTSHISMLFKKRLNISFHEYTSSLRIAKSMKEVSTYDKKIKTISNVWNYPNSTNYIIHFKKYLGVTPKKYKSLSIKAKNIPLKTLVSDYDTLKQIKFESFEKKKDIYVMIDDSIITDRPFSYFNLIDIGPYDNLEMIINEPIFSYKNFSNYKLTSYIYISESFEHVMDDYKHEGITKLRKLLKTHAIALKLSNIESYHFIENIIEELHFLESEHLPTSNKKGQLLLLLDIDTISLTDMKCIKKVNYDTKILKAVDITDFFIHKKMLNEAILHLNPDFYTIDFKKIKQYYQNKQHHLSYSKIQASLFDFMSQNKVGQKIIFVNYDEFYTPTTLSNKGLFLEQSLKSRDFLAGATIHFMQPFNAKQNISIFDNIENKTTFFFLGIMLLNFSKYACYYGDQYVITRTLHGYNILAYNTADYTRNFHIKIPNNVQQTNLLISIEILNNEYGDVDSMIDHTVTNKRHFPDSLKFKLSQYNSPHITVQQHDFDQGSFTATVPPKSIALITIYT